MKSPIFYRFSLMVFVGLVLGVTAYSTQSMAKEKQFKVAGIITAATSHAAGIHIDDQEGHNLTLEEGEGTHKSTGEHSFLDGAQVTIMGMADHINGTGVGQGYAKIMLGKDAVYLKHEGKVSTQPPKQGIRNTTFEGIFSFYQGTGRFKNIQGTGTYQGRYISKTIYILEWEGEYRIK